jgi:hypothetical protein
MDVYFPGDILVTGGRVEVIESKMGAMPEACK